MAEYSRFFSRIQNAAEDYFTRRKALKRIRREKQRKKNPILDWIEAFIWAAGMVLLINQYFFQAYQIPSGSMYTTLNGGIPGLPDDRIFVNKLVYGPELLPGLGKILSPLRPRREDVIIFENPEYVSQGLAFDIAQRVIYMLTFTLADIDKDPAGRPRVHFLIKRAAGMGGDLFESRRGEMFVRFQGEDRWVRERDYTAERGFNHALTRVISDEEYPAIDASGEVLAYYTLGLEAPEEIAAAALNARMDDPFALDGARLRIIQAAYPHNGRYRSWALRNGRWYVPEGRVLPLGDNRDNSKDGRYFGPVKLSKILGQGALIYWPLNRLRLIK